MITDLCKQRFRTDVAIWLLSVLKDPERCVLVLSERRKHLEDIYKLLEPTHGHDYYVGGMKASSE
jgi:hypothetical protein